MANLRISQLPAATTVVSTDILPFTDISASETKKIAMDDLAIALGILGTTVGSSQPSSPPLGNFGLILAVLPRLSKFGRAQFSKLQASIKAALSQPLPARMRQPIRHLGSYGLTRQHLPPRN